MHHQDYIRQLPKNRSLQQTSSLHLHNNRSFGIFNPQLLFLNNTQFQLDIAKDNVIRLKNELINQQLKFEIVKMQKEILHSKVNNNAQNIQTILQSNGINTLQVLVLDDNELTYNSPLLPSKQINFITSLEQHNSSLETQIQAKEYELNSLKISEKATRYTQLYLNYNSSTIQLAELRKNYNLLKFQYDELQYRLNKTIAQCYNFKETIARYKLQSIQYNIRQKKLIKSNSNNSILTNSPFSSNTLTLSIKSPKHNKASIEYSISSNCNSNNTFNFNRHEKQIVELRNIIIRFHYRIEELNKQIAKSENKKNYIESQITKFDTNIEEATSIIKRFEEDIKAFDKKKKEFSELDFDEDIVILKNDIDISKQTLIDLTEIIEKQNKEINVSNKKIITLEYELNKEKAGNRVLVELLHNSKNAMDDLKDRDKDNYVEINILENELKALKSHSMNAN